jgi:hypothetical protein
MLRHTDAQVTTERYAHLVPGYLQEQTTRLKLTGFASPLLPAAANDEGSTDRNQPNTHDFRKGGLERETGVEPATLSLGKRAGVLAPACTKSQSFADPRHSRSEDLHSVSPVARFRSPFAAPVLQGFLTVRDVAAHLCVSTATSTSSAPRASCHTCAFSVQSASRAPTWRRMSGN